MRMKRLVFGLAIAVTLVGLAPRAQAWIPQGWVYAQLPYYYDSGKGAWLWFNDDLPVSDMSTGQVSWFRSRLNTYWLWFNLPWVYNQAQNKWYYIWIDRNAWVCNLSTSQWTIFGRAGMGDVYVTLRWENTSDLDLYVKDPNGELIYYNHKTSASGGKLDVDDRDGYGPENIYWATGTAPSGTYTVYVEYWSGPLPANYNVNINGMVYHYSFPAGTETRYRKQIATFTR